MSNSLAVGMGIVAMLLAAVALLFITASLLKLAREISKTAHAVCVAAELVCLAAAALAGETDDVEQSKRCLGLAQVAGRAKDQLERQRTKLRQG